MMSMAKEYTSLSLVSLPCCSSSGLMYAIVPARAGAGRLGSRLERRARMLAQVMRLLAPVSVDDRPRARMHVRCAAAARARASG